MYQLSKENIGKYEVLHFSDKKSGHHLKVVPEKGGIISEFGMHGNILLKGYDNFAELDTLSWSRAALLAPFPNRLRDGKFSFGGEQFSFPINNEATQTAIHGLIRQFPFTADDIVTEEDYCQVTCSTSYDGDKDYFPFSFKATVIYTLHNEQGLSFVFSVSNTGDRAVPVGLGWHPYFKISEKVDDCRLKLPDLSMVEIDAQMIPTGQTAPFTAFSASEKIEDFVFDNCFKINADFDSEFAEVHLTSKRGTLTYFQPVRYPFLQIFTPPQRDCIAFEPMSCNVDAFNNGEGLQVLLPGESTDLACRVNFVPNKVL